MPSAFIWASSKVSARGWSGRLVVVGLEALFGGFVGLRRGFGAVEEEAVAPRTRLGLLRSRASLRFRDFSEAIEEGWMSPLPRPLALARAFRCCCWWWW